MTLNESPVPVLVSGVKRREDDPVAYAAERGSPKKLKVSLPVESDTLDGDLASGDGGASTMEDVEFDIRLLLRKLVQKQSVAMTRQEMSLCAHPQALISNLWSKVKSNGKFVEMFQKPPLKIDLRDKGWCMPWSHAVGDVALSEQGAGHLLCSVTANALNISSLTKCKKDLDMDSIAKLWSHLFDSPRAMPQEIPVVFKDGLSGVQPVAEYVTKVSKWIRDGTNEMAHALPPSVKFQSCCTKSEVHAILDGIWISEYQNTVSCMKHAVRTVQNSKWKLYSFDERATWQSRKDVADADAAKKDNAKGKTSPAVEFVDVTDALILHELIRRHAIVCKTRSTYGRFVPVLRR